MFLRSPLYDNDGTPRARLDSFLSATHRGAMSRRTLVVEEGKRIQVKNEGGRPHTFTKVAEFGGGRVPPLLVGTQLAPECALAAGATDPYQVAPGARLKLKDKRQKGSCGSSAASIRGCGRRSACRRTNTTSSKFARLNAEC